MSLSDVCLKTFDFVMNEQGTLGAFRVLDLRSFRVHLDDDLFEIPLKLGRGSAWPREPPKLCFSFDRTNEQNAKLIGL